METTEKIVEAYVRYIKGWATIPNLRCEGQFEIDLLAIDSVSLGRYHIETSVSGSQNFSRLTTKAFDPELLKEKVRKAGQRRTLGFFLERTVGVLAVKAELAKYGFVDGEYRSVIVTWDWTSEAAAEAAKAGVALWSFQGSCARSPPRSATSAATSPTTRCARFEPPSAAVAGVKDGAPPFWVYRNWIHHRAMLHRAACGYCRFGAGAQDATGNLTGEWKLFDTLAEAESFVSGLGYEEPLGLIVWPVFLLFRASGKPQVMPCSMRSPSCSRITIPGPPG